MGDSATYLPDTPLTVGFDVRERLARLHRQHTVKGFFTLPVAKRLGPAELDRLRPLLLEPPKRSHLPFTDYPVADHQLLTIELVKREYPRLPLSEGIRRFERSTASRFADSMLGKVVVSVLDGPRSALLKLPDVSARVANLGGITVSEKAGGVLVQYRGYSGFLDCAMIGALEGVVMLFRKSPRVEATIHSEHDGDYLVRWS